MSIINYLTMIPFCLNVVLMVSATAPYSDPLTLEWKKASRCHFRPRSRETTDLDTKVAGGRVRPKVGYNT